MAITLKISANRRNMVHHSYGRELYRRKSGIFKLRRAVYTAANSLLQVTAQGDQTFMQSEQQTATFDVAEAKRILGDVFAPWVQDLKLSLERIECDPPAAAAADWQPGAVLRMPFSERLCRHGGVVCGQALMALADTSMVLAILDRQPRLPADDDGRSNHPLHARASPRRTCWRTRGSSASGAP